MSERVSGKVKWFNDQKGFGIITLDDSHEDLFVHQSSIWAHGFRSLALGESVELLIESNPNGHTKAVDVTSPNQSPVQGSWQGSAALVGGKKGSSQHSGAYSGGGRGGRGDIGGGRACYKCGEMGHIARDCYQGDSGGICYIGGEFGHFAKNCLSNAYWPNVLLFNIFAHYFARFLFQFRYSILN